VAKGDVVIHVPSYLSFSNAATLPCALGSVALALYIHLEIPLPPATVPGGSWIFVYGGSSATGSMAIQFAKL
jgi:NADPH:quinone reductase-like Zn-dependent oxidoreductase